MTERNYSDYVIFLKDLSPFAYYKQKYFKYLKKHPRTFLFSLCSSIRHVPIIPNNRFG